MILLKSREVTHFEQMMKWQPTLFNISSYICNIYMSKMFEWGECNNGHKVTRKEKERERNTGNWNAYAEQA